MKHVWVIESKKASEPDERFQTYLIGGTKKERLSRVNGLNRAAGDQVFRLMKYVPEVKA